MTGEGCGLVCLASVSREDLCTNSHSIHVYDPMRTFWFYLLVHVINGFVIAASFTLVDGAAVAILEEYKGEYGPQRLYANLGAVVLTPVSGFLIDFYSSKSATQDFRPSFYLYCSLKVLGAAVILALDLDFRKPSNMVVKDFRGLLKQPEILAFLFVTIVSGACFGMLETFLFWLLQDLGAKKYMMGITVAVGSLTGIPTLIASGYIFEKLGHANAFIIGFAFYTVRLLGYSFITNPWWSMPFEVLESFTSSLLGAAGVSYAADMATPNTLATLQGMYGGLYFGVGRGVGSLLGGLMLRPLGVRNTYRVMALVCAVTSIVYFTLNRLFFRKLQQQRKIKDQSNVDMHSTTDEERTVTQMI